MFVLLLRLVVIEFGFMSCIISLLDCFFKALGKMSGEVLVGGFLMKERLPGGGWW